MKKLLYALSFAALAFAGCTQDINEVEVAPLLCAPQIKIDGYVNQEYVSRVDDGGFTNGDQIGLYGVNYTDKNALAGELLDEGNQVDNARYTFDAQNKVWTSSGSIYYKDAETNIDLYAYYPYGTIESVNDYLFEVQQDQSGNNAVDGFSQSDFLWGKRENITPTDSAIKIRFDHRLSCVNVVLTEGEGFAEGEFNAVKKSVLVLNTARKATIDLATGVAVATGDIESEGIVTKDGEQGFRAIVVPQSVDAGKALLSITIDGIAVRFKQDATINYEAGKQLNYTLNVGKKAHSGEYELHLADIEVVDWEADLEAHGGEARQYYVVHCDNPGTLDDKIAEAKKDPAKIKNLKVSGKICAVDFTFMRDKMTILQAVNLKEAEIVNYWSQNVTFKGDSSSTLIYFGGEMPADENARHAAVLERYPDKIVTKWGGSKQYTNVANVIPGSAFSGKSSLVYFCFPEKVTKIGSSAFSGTLLSGALIIPNDVTVIGDSAFANTNISSLQLPHNLRTLGDSAFVTCGSLAGTLSLPESLERIGSNCFEGCSMLTGNLVLPHKLSVIQEWCFCGCSGFTGDLIIPDGVTEIKTYAFANCNGFKGALTLPKGLKYLYNSAFSNCYFQGELVIPSQIQNIPSSCFWCCDFSNIVFAENSELIKIESHAFYYNSRLCEPIVLPEGVITIESEAFYNCSTLPAIVLPKSLTVIGQSAFYNCYNLSSITCKATTPPVCGAGAWDGVAKDNFTVEVPEQSVVKYQTEGGWNDFKRIAAHHDFSISCSQLRTLNAEHSKTFVMRAPSGEAWSIESKPEWVTVTPSSGVGKVDVTVTVAEMTDAEVGRFKAARPKTSSDATVSYKTYKGRAGEVVFLLEGKDYRTKMTIEQYDYDYADGDVLVNQKASVGNGVNIVFMGDCFDARDIAEGKYLKGVEEAIGHYFAIEPYKTYKEYFNIYTVFGMSADSGMGTVNTIKEAKFGSQYSLDGIAPNHATCYEYAMKTETVNKKNLNQTLVVLVENTTDYGGICYMWGDGSAIACCPMSADAYPFDFRGIVQHEAGGHGFGKLADEYIYHNAFIQSCTCNCCDHLNEFNAAKARGWYRNLSTNGDMKSVEWSHLIYHPDYSNIVDMYEGGFFHTRGIYRSEATSCMNNNIPYYSAISRQAMVERIMKYAGKEFDINEFYAKDVRDASNNTRSATRLSVEDNALTLKGASKQLPPKYMGDKPQLKKSNK